jgi:hypothetical protein
MTDTITTINFYSKFKENKENDMAAQVFWAVFFPPDSQAKSDQQLISTVLPFHPLYFPCSICSSSLCIMLAWTIPEENAALLCAS